MSIFQLTGSLLGNFPAFCLAYLTSRGARVRPSCAVKYNTHIPFYSPRAGGNLSEMPTVSDFGLIMVRHRLVQLWIVL